MTEQFAFEVVRDSQHGGWGRTLTLARDGIELELDAFLDGKAADVLALFHWRRSSATLIGVRFWSDRQEPQTSLDAHVLDANRAIEESIRNRMSAVHTEVDGSLRPAARRPAAGQLGEGLATLVAALALLLADSLFGWTLALGAFGSFAVGWVPAVRCRPALRLSGLTAAWLWMATVCAWKAHELGAFAHLLG